MCVCCPRCACGLYDPPRAPIEARFDERTHRSSLVSCATTHKASSRDPAAIAGYFGKTDAMDDAIARFAFAYAEQTDRDYDALKLAAKSKRIQVAKPA